MPLSLVFHAFLARAAVGTVVSLLVVMRMRAAERHVRFQCVLAAALAGGAAALYLPALGGTFRPEFPRGPSAFTSTAGGIPAAAVLFGFLCLVARAGYGEFRRSVGRAALVAAALLGVVVCVGTARLGPGDGAAAVAGRTAGAALGGLLFGGVNDAMILGHFYLMIRGLPLDALRRTGTFCVAAILLRVAGFVAVLLFWPGAWDTLLGPELVWTAWRVSFGFVGPLSLVLMMRNALSYKHTQASTGILYVAIFFALMGELPAVWMELRTGIPV